MKKGRQQFSLSDTSKAFDVIMAILAGVVVFIPLRLYVVQGYYFSSNNMADTFVEGDFVLINKVSYDINPPKQGDLVTFKYPLNITKDYLKRVIATEGQTVQIENKIVYVNNEPTKNFSNVKYNDATVYPLAISNRDNLRSQKIPENSYFVLGDNRDNSDDSRFWGALEEKYIIGKPMIVYFSWKPDPRAPELTPPYIMSSLKLIIYNIANIFDRIRWSRLGKVPQ